MMEEPFLLDINYRNFLRKCRSGMSVFNQNGLLLVYGTDTFGNATLSLANTTNNGTILVGSDTLGSPHNASLVASSTLANRGLIQFVTDNGGTRTLNGTVDNDMGIITVESVGLSLISATIAGGTINGSGTVSPVESTSTLDGVTLAGTVTARIDTSAALVLKNTVTNNATISLNDTAAGDARLSIAGNVTLGGTGQVLFATNSPTGNVININSGINPVLTIGPGQTLRAPVNTGGTISANTVNQGKLAVDGTLQVSSASFVNALSGVISGSGTLNLGGTNLSNRGTVAPGNSTGTLTMNGNYTQDTSGKLAVELGGTAAGAFDKLVVNGTAFLDGEVNVSLLGGFVPNINDTFTILAATTVNNTNGLLMTAADDPYYDLIFNPASVVLKVVAVPPAPGVPGDYNNNGTVDAADYTV